MNNIREVYRYAQAVFIVAEKLDQLSDLYKNTNKLLLAYKTSPDLRMLLQSKRISQKSKLQILKVIFNNFLSNLELELLFQLVADGKVVLLESIVKRIQLLIESKSTSLKVTISTPKALPSENLAGLVSEIEKKLEKKIEMRLVVKPEILGGATFRIGNTIIDGSLSTRLQRLGDSLYE